MKGALVQDVRQCRKQQDDKTESLQQCEKVYSLLHIIVKASLAHITETDAMSSTSKSTIEGF
jgi:hypothetical protein